MPATIAVMSTCGADVLATPIQAIRQLLAELADFRAALASMGEWPFEGEPDVWSDD